MRKIASRYSLPGYRNLRKDSLSELILQKVLLPRRKKPTVQRRQTVKPPRAVTLSKRKVAIKGQVAEYVVDGIAITDEKVFLAKAKEAVVGLIESLGDVKIRVVMKCTMVKENPADGTTVRQDVHFSTKIKTVLSASDANEIYDICSEEIIDKIAE